MGAPRILLQGVGGIGGVTAARLLRAGHDVTLVTGNPEIAGAIDADGLRVETLGERFIQGATAHASLDDLPGDARFDVALLMMKAQSVVEASRRTLPLLEPDAGYLVTCQNGIVEDAVAEVVGEHRVVSGIVGWGGTMHEPGVYQKTGPGEIHIGELDGTVTDRLRALSSVLVDVTPVVVTDNIRGALWSKLSINCIVTTLGALTGQTLGEMLSQRRIRDVALVLYREVVDTAHARGVELTRIAADPILLYLPADAGPVRRLFKDLVARFVGRRYAGLRSSMLQSLERGRPSEIDYLNGYVVERAGERSRVPLNARLVEMIKEIESGEREIAPANLDELATLLR
jgi:2-dehydropantoate 2-reductase